MYLHRSELVSDIERLMRSVEGESTVTSKCEESLRVLDGLGEESVKECIRSNHCIIEAFVLGLSMEMQMPMFVIDYVYTFLVNELLAPDDVREVVEQIARGGWCEASKMKILQMSYYFVRCEGFTGDVVFSLFKTVFKLVEDRNRQIQTTAKPIAMHIVESVFNRACPRSRDMPCSVSEGEEEDGEETCGAGSDKLPQRKAFETLKAIDDGAHLLEFLLSKARTSGDTMCFTVEIIILITQKDELFECQEFRKLYGTGIADILVEQVRRGSSVKGGIYRIVARLATRHVEILGSLVQRILDEAEKSYRVFSECESQMFLEFFGDMDPGVFSSCGATVRRIFFRILGEASFENEDANRGVIRCIEKSLGNQMREQAGNRELSDLTRRVFFDKFSRSLYTKLMGAKDVHPSTGGLLKMVLDFYAVAGDRESLEKFIDMGFGLGFSEVVCRSAVENRKHIQDTWDAVLRGGKERIKPIMESISSFNGEELFFLTKAIGTMDTRWEGGLWTPKDKIDLCRYVFSIVKPVVVEPLNIRIFEILLTGILQEEDGGYGTGVFCSIVTEYFEQAENLSPDIESVVFTLVQKMLMKDPERNGAEVLRTLSEVLRLTTPSGGWSIILGCIECACIPSLYSLLFPIVRWIIGEFSGPLDEDGLKTIIGCLHTMCLCEDGEISLKCMFIFQDVGECLVSRKMIGYIPSSGARPDVEDLEKAAWIKYLETLGQMSGDPRPAIRETAARYFFGFIEAELNITDTDEWDFVSRHCLAPLFGESRRLIASSAPEDIGSSMLILRESNDMMRRSCYNRGLFGEFLSLMEYGICSSGSSDVQSLCIEGLRIATRRISEAVDKERKEEHRDVGTCDGDVQAMREEGMSGDGDVYSDGDGSKSGRKGGSFFEGSGKCVFGDGVVMTGAKMQEVPGVGLREQVLNTYRSILADGTVSSRCGSVNLELIEVFRTFPFRSTEFSSFILFLHRLIGTGDRCIQERVLELTEHVGCMGGMCDVLLESYNSWMDSGDVYLSSMLMERMGRMLSRNGRSGRYGEVVSRLVEYCKHPSMWESSVRAFMKSSENIGTRTSFVSFVEGSSAILEELCMSFDSSVGGEDVKEEGESVDEARDRDGEKKRQAGEARRKERMVLEFLSFYHGVILRFREASTRAGGGHGVHPFNPVSSTEISEAYKVILGMSEEKSRALRENIMLKCYTILFHDIGAVYEEMVPRIRRVLLRYNEIEAIYNGLCSRVKQREIYAILEGVCRSGDRRLIGDIKDLLVESLRSKDHRIIEYVRRSLEIMFGT